MYLSEIMKRFILEKTKIILVEKHELPFLYKDDSYQIKDILSDEILELSTKRIISALGEGGFSFGAINDEKLFLSYPCSRILVSLLGDRRVVYQYAKEEARIAMNQINKNNAEKLQIIQELGVECKWRDDFGMTRKREEFGKIENKYDFISNHSQVDNIEKKKRYEIGGDDKYYDDYEIEEKRLEIGLFDFTNVSSNGRINSWDIYNYPVKDGLVYIDASEVEDFLYELIFIEIYKNLPLDVPDEIEEDITSRGFIDELSDKIPEEAFSYEIDEVKEDLFPPVIKSLISDINSGVNLKHEERYTVGSFLITIGMTNDEIVELFGLNDHFAEEPTREQLQHIREGEYVPPAYDSIEAIGYEWQKDELEKKVGHPLQYYREKLKEDKKEKDK